MRILRKTFVSIVSITLLCSCGGSGDPKPTGDNEKPVISVDVPKSNQIFERGGLFYFTGKFTDNSELAKVTFSLKDNKPAQIIKSTSGVEDDPWQPADYVLELSGKSNDIDQAIFNTDESPIPSNVYTGSYTLTVTCRDKTGNEATTSVDISID